MAPRKGLYVALIGLVLAVLCGGATLLMSDVGKTPPDNGWADMLMKGVVVVYFAMFIGFLLVLVVLAMAVAGAVIRLR